MSHTTQETSRTLVLLDTPATVSRLPKGFTMIVENPDGDTIDIQVATLAFGEPYFTVKSTSLAPGDVFNIDFAIIGLQAALTAGSGANAKVWILSKLH